MALPKVAIVGRPNVGKSALFNCLAQRRISIVEPTAGVTRDRLATHLELDDGRHVEVIDTGGMGIEDRDQLTADVERQISLALAEADLVLFVVDARDGVVPLDELVSERLRGLAKPVILVVNKCDEPRHDLLASDFARLGWQPMVTTSAHHQRGRGELLDLIASTLPADVGCDAVIDPIMKLAIVGRRNTGKSTFINSLARQERVIVSEVPGTTRDSIDVRFERDGRIFLAIDTAGVRKKSSIANSIEFYSLARAERSIRRADVVLLFLDATEPVSMVDKQLVTYIHDNWKPAIYVVNKWDLAKSKRADIVTEDWGEYLREFFPTLDHVPIAFITAKDGKNVQRVLNLAQQLHKQATARVSTGQLNAALQSALAANPPPVSKGRPGRIYFATQTDIQPPTLVFFTNDPEKFHEPYRRYLLKHLRETLPFPEVPIRTLWRAKGQAPADGESAPPSSPRKLMGRPLKKARPTAESIEESLPSQTQTDDSKPKAHPPASARAKKRNQNKPAPISDIWRDL